MPRVAAFRCPWLALPVLLLTACAQPAPPAPAGPPPSSLGGIQRHFDLKWAQNRLWDDGLAEVATYAAEQVLNKQPRPYELTIITMKEDFSPASDTQTADPRRPGRFAVMKVNAIGQVPAGGYPRQFLTSLFFRREDPLQLHKLTSSAQDWNGNVFKALTDSLSRYDYAYNSYHDGQGAGRRTLPRDIVLEDALPYTLRGLRFNDEPLFELNVLENQQTSPAAEPKLYRAEVRVARAADAEAPRPSWRVTVRLERDKDNVYWFDQHYPHLLLRHRAWDGRTLLLKNERRYAYWQQ